MKLFSNEESMRITLVVSYWNKSSFSKMTKTNRKRIKTHIWSLNAWIISTVEVFKDVYINNLRKERYSLKPNSQNAFLTHFRIGTFKTSDQNSRSKIDRLDNRKLLQRSWKSTLNYNLSVLCCEFASF